MQWTLLSLLGDGPGPRSSHAACAVGRDALLVYGGELRPRVPVEDAGPFLLKDGKWSRVDAGSAKDAPGPGPRIAATMAALGSTVYLFGIEMGEGARDDMWALDLEAPSAGWRVAPVCSGAPSPPARSFHATAAAGGRVYIFGGCGAEGRLKDLWRYDPAAAAWEELPAPPEGALPRGGASLVTAPGASGDLLVVVGGRELGDCLAFDAAANAWRAAPSIPPRSVLAAGAHACSESRNGGEGGQGEGSCGHAGHVLLFGGEVDPSTQGHAGAGGFSAEIYCLDPCAEEGDTHALRPKPDPAAGAPCARGWGAAAVVGSSLVVHGGVDVHNTRLGDVWELRLH